MKRTQESSTVELLTHPPQVDAATSTLIGCVNHMSWPSKRLYAQLTQVKAGFLHHPVAIQSAACRISAFFRLPKPRIRSRPLISYKVLLVEQHFSTILDVQYTISEFSQLLLSSLK